jgi:hypothetical protein
MRADDVARMRGPRLDRVSGEAMDALVRAVRQILRAVRDVRDARLDVRPGTTDGFAGAVRDLLRRGAHAASRGFGLVALVAQVVIERWLCHA